MFDHRFGDPGSKIYSVGRPVKRRSNS
jgi:hypothetical protein